MFKNSGQPSYPLSGGLQRIRLTVRGIVQGVGMRPFLHRLAEDCCITGWVRNTGGGLEGELEGSGRNLSQFLNKIRTAPPALAEIERVDADFCQLPDAEPPGAGPSPLPGAETPGALYADFRILESEITPFDTLIAPDTAPCPDCRRELFDKSDRRFRYPFINCTNCGPRYTIQHGLPYDRQQTSMSGFPMCRQCGDEYSDIENRRYHAQPNCCSLCGPEAFFLGADQTPQPGDAFFHAQKTLAEGGILAIKGTGGIHLACNAANDSAVAKLRKIKQRFHKPFALMCRSLDTARALCHVSEEEAELLSGRKRPIVLLSKKESFPYSSASGESPRAGLMLPYTPLHELIMDGTSGGPDVVVMTSANRPSCPVLTENEEALEVLSGSVDGFLFHDRPIANRCDDSLASLWEGHPYFFRRSRGYTPAPLAYAKDVTGIFAFGAEQKASFALGRKHHIFLSPHIGDLKNAETLAHYGSALKTYRHLFHLKPSICVCDSHPDYLSSSEAAATAARENVPLLAVQHHWAHMASCMADNGLEKTAFGILWDGSGLAPDHSVWGGEYMVGGTASYERAGSIRPLRLIGGDTAVREIGRIGVSLLSDCGITDDSLYPCSIEKSQKLKHLLSSPFTVNASSMGRLFDGVCSILCQKTEVEYEGEGAVLLESLSPFEEPVFSAENGMENLSYTRTYYEKSGVRIWDTRPVIREICEDIKKGKPAPQTALRFLITLCCSAKDQTIALNRERLPVVLSGGVFQNRFLLSGITALLRQSGFTVYSHRRTAPNDEGLSLGQLAIARTYMEKHNMNGGIMKFESIKKIHSGNFIHRYDITYKTEDNETKVYEMISRSPSIKTLEDLHGKSPDAVVLIIQDTSGEKLLLNREFRMAAGQWIINFPAGLIDSGETPEQSAVRELKEETGLDLVEITGKMPLSYSAVGFSNETNICLTGIAAGEFHKSSSSVEEIRAAWYTKEEVRKLLETELFAARTQAYCYLWSRRP